MLELGLLLMAWVRMGDDQHKDTSVRIFSGMGFSNGILSCHNTMQHDNDDNSRKERKKRSDEKGLNHDVHTITALVTRIGLI